MTSPLDSMSLRHYAQIHLPDISPSQEFRHTEPADKPTEPDKSAFTAQQHYEAEQYIKTGKTPTDTDVLTWQGDYDTYKANLQAWENTNQAQRVAQWRGMLSDAHVVSLTVTPPSQTDDDDPDTEDVPPRVTPKNPTP